LRRREGDIPLLVQYFLGKFNRQLHKNIKSITPNAMAVLESYPWPGNIRELENLIERMVVLGSNSGWIDQQDLPVDVLFHETTVKGLQATAHDGKGLIKARQSFERQYIIQALQKCEWNQTEAARLLQIHRNTLIQKMKLLNIRNKD
jgi:two-component system response regulator AtoC